MFNAIVYTMSCAMLAMIIFSYYLGYRIKSSPSVLSLLLFFITVFFTNVAIVYKLLGFGSLPGIGIRGTLLLLSTSFLLHTAWKRD